MKPKKPGNPFVLSGYYGMKWFCDRERELRVLEDHVANDRNVVLYSWRRMGKTSLIRAFFSERVGTGAYETLYADMLATESVEDAVHAMTVAVYDRYGRTAGGTAAALRELLSTLGVTLRFDPLTGHPELAIGVSGTGVPERSLQALGSFLSQRRKKVLFALDEFQQVTHYKEGRAEAVFRAWAQEFPALRFIYSGSHRGMMQAMFAEKNRPFYQSGQMMSLDPIPEDEYVDFIQGHFASGERLISDDLIREIYRWARGQTYAVQRICNYLYAQFDTISEKELHAVRGQFLEQDAPLFADYQRMLTRGQWALLRAIAREEPVDQPTAANFMHRHDLGAASSVAAALKTLEKLELVIREGSGYMIHDVLLARWLQSL